MAARDLDENRQELARAIEDIDMDRVRELLDAGDVDLDAPLDGNGRTYLLMAAEYGSDEMLEMVLDAGANPNQPNHYGITPMHLCAQLGISTKLMLLLQAGASLNPQDKGGETPLHKAANCSRADYVSRLLDAGVDSTLQDVDGRTADALMDSAPSSQQAIRDNQSPPLADTREAFTKEDLMTKNDAGLSALDAGATWRRAPVVLEALASEGTHFTRDEMLQAGKGGKTPMQRALENGAGAAVIQHLQAHGEGLQPQDLVQDRKPTALLEAAIKHKAVGALFTEKAWEGQSAEEMSAVYRAMPEQGQQQVANYHSLRVQLNETAQVQQAGKGR